MLKKLLLPSALFLFCISSVSAQEKKLKHTVGVFASPVTISFWTYPEYTVNEEWSSNPKRLKLSFGTPFGISYQYRLLNSLAFQCAAAYGYESGQFTAVTQEKSSVEITDNIYYLQVPVGIRFYPGHIDNPERNSGFFMQLNGNFDFVVKEDAKRTEAPFYDPRFSYPGYVQPEATTTITNSNKLKLHRFSPCFLVGNEIGEKHFSFMYAAKLQIPAVQWENTQENFKNIQTSLVLGFNYRF